jgi:hypothetical protein
MKKNKKKKKINELYGKCNRKNNIDDSQANQSINGFPSKMDTATTTKRSKFLINLFRI